MQMMGDEACSGDAVYMAVEREDERVKGNRGTKLLEEGVENGNEVVEINALPTLNETKLSGHMQNKVVEEVLNEVGNIINTNEVDLSMKENIDPAIIIKGLGSRPSYTWRSLMAGRELLSAGLYRSIGDGRSTMVWKDPWIPGIKVGELTTIRNEAVNYTRICDLFSVNNRGWDRQVLNTIFDRDTVEKILCIPINRIHLPDRWAWKGESNENFTVKSCYKLGMRDHWENINLTPDLFCDVPTAFWKSMWKLPVLSRFKVNFWRACLGIIPTLDALEKRGVLINEACVFCERETESAFHIFTECQAVKQVWEEASSIFQAGNTTNRCWNGCQPNGEDWKTRKDVSLLSLCLSFGK
ncbi:uncharacterized protein G2W53_034133 [Senna tora]|uniref:Reverse transcriptase zinc-binding domain-containing protein n=1 Tax=Senna tora TaxID=362788 RepID=A0A834W8M5_9FABA|nr:uncharacterized protein G2W53_034133 [Senna tora]